MIACCCFAVFAFHAIPAAAAQQPPSPLADKRDQVVGPTAQGGYVIPSSQLLHPAGVSLEIKGRPVDMALSRDGGVLAVKDNRGVVLMAVKPDGTMELSQEVSFGDNGGSMTGIAFTRDGSAIYATDSANDLIEVQFAASVKAETDKPSPWTISRRIKLPGPRGLTEKDAAFGCGLVLSPDEKTAYVCLSRNNTLGVVDLVKGELVSQIDVGVAPFTVVLSADGASAYVSNWGGRRAKEGEKTADSGGTQTLIDSRGIASSGGVSIIDLQLGKEAAYIETGLSACGLCLSADGRTLYVANANSDTVAFVDVAKREVTSRFSTRPVTGGSSGSGLPFGSMPNGLARSRDGGTLFISNAGNNAVAAVSLTASGSSPVKIDGLIPTWWYPGAIIATDSSLFVANIKGAGSRTTVADKKGFNSRKHSGTVQRIDIPTGDRLSEYTTVAMRDCGVPAVLRAIERKQAGAAAVPVPASPGEPCVFDHIIYIIKENRTFDQVFGDMPNCNADPSLCIYGREITPNIHALAEQFVLLDNFYCNGVLSADGHSWATEGNVTPYLERSFGGFSRSYTFGDDPLTYSSSGFIWDHVLAAGLTFRNYGEFDDAGTEPRRGYKAVFDDWMSGAKTIKFTHSIGVENVRHYTCAAFPGWDLNIPDQVRADIFLEEFEVMDKGVVATEGEANAEVPPITPITPITPIPPALKTLPNFTIMYLPNDHTAGLKVGTPTPRTMMADNDFALGRIIDRITHSRFWKTTCIFVIEDDPQDGWDHVDGHRSTCLVISPYTKRGVTVSKFYNQTSVVHTMERMMGLTAANQLYAASPLMTDCFTAAIDATPFAHLKNIVPLCEIHAAVEPEKKWGRAHDEALKWELATENLPLDKPDMADEDTLNRILWFAAKGNVPYPKEVAGAHGKGLAAIGLKLDGSVVEDDEDDDDD